MATLEFGVYEYGAAINLRDALNEQEGLGKWEAFVEPCKKGARPDARFDGRFRVVANCSGTVAKAFRRQDGINVCA